MAEMSDIDEIMYACGLDVLHPGGIEKTDEMARMCRIGRGTRTLDVGAGKGASACHLAGKYGCEVVGIDASEKMVAHAQETARRMGVADKALFQRADAQDMPFEDGAFDIVLSECTTTLLDKAKAFAEFLRVAKPGGRIGDLEMTWRKPPPEDFAERVESAWGGFTTMTLPEWEAFLKETGMVEVEAVDFSEESDFEAEIRKTLGLAGVLKMAWRLLRRPDLRRMMRPMSTRQWRDFVGYAYFVGKKPLARQGGG